MFCRIFLALLLAASLSKASAQRTISAKEITSQVLTAVSNYQAAISCGGADPTAKDIIALSPLKSDDDFDAKYAVFWTADIGCAGGSGTVSTNLAIVKRGVGTTLLVDPYMSSPAITLDFPGRGFEKAAKKTSDTIVVEAADYASKDANCCPTLRFQYTLRADKKGNWKQIDKKQLPSKKY